LETSCFGAWRSETFSVLERRALALAQPLALACDGFHALGQTFAGK
jgi:hypothetical protein